MINCFWERDSVITLSNTRRPPLLAKTLVLYPCNKSTQHQLVPSQIYFIHETNIVYFDLFRIRMFILCYIKIVYNCDKSSDVTRRDLKLSFSLGAIRSIDVFAAIFGGALLLPVMLVLGAMVRRDSPGPALLRQTRVGRGEKPFTCYKFRTMAQGTPVVGTHEAPPSAVTRLGASLRRLKLDELPQLWNVALGEMSLVGPRPSLPSQFELIAERRARGIYAARPGITGPSQVKGIDMSTPTRLAIEDETWVRSPSVAKYFSYIFQTVRGGGQGDRVRG